MTENWQLLYFIYNSLGRLDHPLYQTLAHGDYPREYLLLALENALRSGKIPMRGCRVTAFGLEASERIEAKIGAETKIDVTLDEVALRKLHPDHQEQIEFAVFKRVQADLPRVERLLSRVRAGGPHERDRHVLASFTDAKITDFLRSSGLTNMDDAWLLVKDEFPGVRQVRFRGLWKLGRFGGHPGRPVNSVGNSVKI